MKILSPGVACNILVIFNKNVIETYKLVSSFNFRNSNFRQNYQIPKSVWLVWQR